MNTTLLKTFGQKARTLLIDGVTRKLHYWGFDKDGAVTECTESIPGGYLFREGVFDDTTVPRLWQSLEEAVNKDGLHEVAERAAYIWFNRLMALKILGKNNYEQPLLEPVSVEEQTPLVVKRARGGQYDFLNKSEQERLKKILTDYEKETQVFAILLIGFCHSHSLLNRVFGTIDDYTELLLPDDVLSSGGFLDLLNNGDYITHDDYKQVELIGWLYQFYISEKKDQVFKKFKDGKKAEAKDIPAATQIFTPNWIVKYMVENTVGKIWLEKHPHSPIKESLRYLVEGADNDEIPEPIIEEVKDLKLLDPASGSGHILVEGFELLYKMYLEEYYPPDEAVESILQNNLYGLDIDLRAAQLAQFAVLMKAAQFHPDVLKRDIIPHIYAMPSPVHFTIEDVQSFLGEEGSAFVKPLQDALRLMLQAQNLGSIMQLDINEEIRIYILQQLRQWKQRTNLDFLQQELFNKLSPYINVIEVLTQQYEAVVANPPYMGQGNMNGQLKSYINSSYPASKSDLMTVFMEVGFIFLCRSGKMAMINLPSWMFLSSFEKFRSQLVSNYFITSLVHLGRGVFGSDFGSVTFCFCKSKPKQRKAIYRRLYQEYVKVDNVKIKEERFFDLSYGFYVNSQENFFKIPGSPIAYWIGEKIADLFTKEKISSLFVGKEGVGTRDDDRFIRNFWEVSNKKIGIDLKWVKTDKAGGFRKWYGNLTHVMNWENDGLEIKSFKDENGKLKSRPQNTQYLFKEAITWGKVTAGVPSFRFRPEGLGFNDAAPSLFGNVSKSLCLAFLNSKVSKYLIEIFGDTMNFTVGVIESLPFLIEKFPSEVKKAADNSIEIMKRDWDSREISWDFERHPLTITQEKKLAHSFQQWLQNVSIDFFKIHKNEEELNEIFINIYGLQDDLTKNIALKEITILQDELDYEKLAVLKPPFDKQLLPIKTDVPIQQLVSYAIGCFMGRYRLDNSGLHIAHANTTPRELEAYIYTSRGSGEKHWIEIDEDGIIPLMGSKGNFSDDAYNRLRQFLVAIWGDDTLTQNINFMQECLNQNLEDYLIKKLWSYHVRMYGKKPIYWLFSSKNGAFQALVYMHRMNRFTAEKLRDKYLLKHIQFLEQEITRMEGNMTGLTKSEQKKLDQLHKDRQECNDYDFLLKDIATKQIEFDLDDGVTRNYELFKGVVAPIK